MTWMRRFWNQHLTSWRARAMFAMFVLLAVIDAINRFAGENIVVPDWLMRTLHALISLLPGDPNAGAVLPLAVAGAVGVALSPKR